MKLKIFAVLDSKMGVFNLPWFEANEAVAMRSFSDNVNDPNPLNQWNKHPEDFTLYEIGVFDREIGELVPIMPKSIITASALKEMGSQTMDYNYNGKEKVPVK